MPYIVKFSDNYADEFDVEGFKLYKDEKEFREFLDLKERVFNWFESERIKRVIKYSKQYPQIIGKTDEERYQLYIQNIIPYNVYRDITRVELSVGFGTNEDLTFSRYRDFESSFTVTAIYIEEYETIRRVIGTSFGETCAFYALGSYDEEDE